MTSLRLGLVSTLALLAGCNGSPDVEAPSTLDAAVSDASSSQDATRWIVTSADPRATEAGAQILREGGSAVDAAIAVQAVLSLVEPQSSGLGGGAFMLFYDADEGRIISYDGRETAPQSATPELFLDANGEPLGFYDAITSGRSVGVPGAVAMLEMAHNDHGILPWSDLFGEAERLATDGFEVSERLSFLLGRVTRLPNFPAARALYFDAEGAPVTPGTILQVPDYAQSVRLIASGGAAAFYTGPIAEQIVEAVNEVAGPGTMTLTDLSSYQPIIRDTVCGEFLAYNVCSMAPPSSGGVTMLQTLGMLETLGIDELAPNSPEAWALYGEASRLAYADRAQYLGDPSAMTFGEHDAAAAVEAMIDPGYLSGRAGLIGESAAETVEAGDPLSLSDEVATDASTERPGTSHFSIRDQAGNIVSMTTTIESAFGSHIMAGGMMLNNELTDFSRVPEIDGLPVVNAPGAGKRPRSSMTPTIVLDESGVPIMAIGSPGGSSIIGYVSKTVLASLAWDMPLQEAVELPNIVTPRGGVIVEEGADTDLIDGLTAYGHSVRTRPLTSGLYGFRLRGEEIETGVDPRRDGTVQISN